MDILIAEDDRSTRLLLEALLRAEGYSVVAVGDGRLALDALSASPFDAVVTDWMMPQMDGIELVQWIRAAVKPAPVVLMVTAADTDAARNRALEAGADDYLVKPVRAAALRRQLAEAIARRQQAAPPAPGPPQILLERRAPPFRCVAFVASSGGPVALLELLRGVRQRGGVAGVVVLRGPQWMLESLAARLRLETSWPARVLTDGDQVLPGELSIVSHSLSLTIAEPPRWLVVEGLKRGAAAADSILECCARLFGQSCTAAILTGLGQEGVAGAACVAAAGGAVLVQDPATALVPQLPQGILAAGMPARVLPLNEMARVLQRGP